MENKGNMHRYPTLTNLTVVCDFFNTPKWLFVKESMIKQPKTTSNFGVPSSILGDPIPWLIFDQVSSSPNTSQFHDPFMIIPRVFYLCKDNRKVICNHSIPQVYCWVGVHTGFPFISIYDIIFIELWSFPICHFHASFMTNDSVLCKRRASVLLQCPPSGSWKSLSPPRCPHGVSLCPQRVDPKNSGSPKKKGINMIEQ